MALRFSRDPRTMTSEEVWAEALARPGFKAALDAGLADLAAGRMYRLNTKTGETTPNPDWPKDGPQPREHRMTEPREPEPEEPDVRNDPIPEPVRETEDDTEPTEETP